MLHTMLLLSGAVGIPCLPRLSMEPFYIPSKLDPTIFVTPVLLSYALEKISQIKEAL